MAADGLCECGCGERTNLAPWTTATKGWVKGEPLRFIAGHHGRQSPVEYIVGDDGCWIWQRARFGNGYGQAWHEKRPFPAHRMVYERHRGPIPVGLDLDHLCRQPLCVNPDHLEPVTRSENTRRGAGTKLNPDLVREIRAATGTHADVARAFGLGPTIVSAVRRRVRWGDVV